MDIPAIAAIASGFAMFVGVLGIGIAVHFQLVSRREYPIRYVAAFFLFGSIVVMFNAEALRITDLAAATLTILAGLVALIVELYAALWVASRCGRYWDEWDVSDDYPGRTDD